ncbi:MAG: lycopene cyclase family protein [Paludibacter sp.]|nr:lycopene cyclase family protein [Paludibacter sp.]
MNSHTSSFYDYIIAGSGCAGLTLLYRMLRESALNKKKILVIDRARKTDNDRTWCFWEKEDGLFQSIVYHQWDELDFFSSYYSDTLRIAPYRYKMIRGMDFYKYVHAFAAQFVNVEFRYEHIERLYVSGKVPFIKTTSGTYSASYIFNSTKLFYPAKNVSGVPLLMHFKGWAIKTEQSGFNFLKGTLMDFNVEQHGGTAFMYMLPTRKDEALVEYTLFTPRTLNLDAYVTALNEYIRTKLNIKNFELTREESGVIPLMRDKFPTHLKHKVIHIGTAGGCVKASSGYAFEFIQIQTEKIIRQLKKGKSPVIRCSFTNKKFLWYDRTFLYVLASGKMKGAELMARIIEKVSPDKVFDFLSNKSNFIDDFNIMKSLPAKIFLPAALRQL